MKSKTIAVSLLVCCAWGAAANAAQLATTTCDRECLRGRVTQLLYALLKHDVSGLPVAETLRVTEDAVEKPLAKVGLVGTVTRLRGFRQDIIDERAGVAGAHVVVEETGAPVLLVVRLKVVADEADRNRAGGDAQPRGRAQRREDLRRRERTLRAQRLSLRERPGDGRAGLQVRPRLPEHLHSVMRILPVEKRNGGWE